MTTLPTTIDPPADYTVMVVEAAAPGWLHLPSLHAKLLPLALAAGHERLVLTCHFGGESHSYYEAEALAGTTGFRRYITWLDEGDQAEDFERVLTEKLQQQADLRAMVQEAAL
jgi:hypothetical protein